MKGTEPTVEEIRRRLQEAGAREFAVLERSLVADTRKGVRAAVETARRRRMPRAAPKSRRCSSTVSSGAKESSWGA